MVFEKKQLSKALAIALMVACAVAFMPLLNGQAFAAAKKPAKVKSLKAAQVANTMTAKATWKKGKNCKKYNVKVDGVLVSKKQKAKSYTTVDLTEGAHKIAVAGVNGKKVGKYKTVTVNIVAPTPPPVTKLEVTGVVQSGVKQLKVTFSTAVDPTGLTFKVTRAGKEVTATAKADPTDPNSVLLDLDAAIVDGVDYAVSVFAGDGIQVPTAAGAKTDVTGEKEVVASIAVDEHLILKEIGKVNATGGYTILNQFKEDVTSTYAKDMNITCSLGTAKGYTNGKGNIDVELASTTLAVVGTKGTIVAVYTKTGVNTSAEVTVSEPSAIKEISVLGVYNSETGEQMSINANDVKKNANAVLVFSVEDQYGNALGYDGITKSVAGGLTGLNNENTGFGTVTIDEVDYPCITFEPKVLESVAAGDATIVLVANATGARATYTLTVGDANVIANLTVTPPEKVIGGDDNEFKVEATNAAGEAITSYKLLKGKFTPQQTNGFTLKENGDGSASLIYSPGYTNKDYDLRSQLFQTTDTYKTCFVTFTVLPGKDIPAEVTDVQTYAVDGDTYFVSAKYEDVFGNEMKSDSEFSTYFSDEIGGVKVELADNKYIELQKSLEGTEIAENEWVVADDGLSATLDADNYDITNFTGLVATLKKDSETDEAVLPAGKAATGSVTVTLLDDEGKEILTSSKSLKITVTNGIEKYDTYEVRVTNEDVVDANGEPLEDIDTIYIGEAEKDSSGKVNWIDGKAPSHLARKFNVSVWGKMNGSTTWYYVNQEGFVVEDSEELIGSDNVLTLTPQVALDALAGDTISLYLPSEGATAVAEKTVTFAQEARVATAALDDEYDALGLDKMTGASITGLVNVDNNVIDQYGVCMRSASKVLPDYAVTLVNVKDNTTGEYLDEDDYTVSYNGRTNFALDLGQSSENGYDVTVTIAGGNINQTIVLKKYATSL